MKSFGRRQAYESSRGTNPLSAGEHKSNLTRLMPTSPIWTTFFKEGNHELAVAAIMDAYGLLGEQTHNGLHKAVVE